jgi:hypothetical protein
VQIEAEVALGESGTTIAAAHAPFASTPTMEPSCMRTPSRNLRAFVLLVVTAALLVHQPSRIHAQAPAMRWDGLIEHITAANLYFGDPQPNGPSQLPRHSVSADGRYLVFRSDATNLAGDGMGPVYLRDRDTGQVSSLFPHAVRNLALSADGNHVAFELCEPGWRPDSASTCDIWTYNFSTRMLHAISVAPDGSYGDADSTQPMLSSTGRFVVFRTNASNLLPPGAAPGQILIRDRDADGNGIFDEPGTEVTEVVSAVQASSTPGNNVSESAEVSDDGRYVAFRSLSSNLVAGDTNGTWDVFLRDRLIGETRRLNLRPGGMESPFPIDSPDISMTPDGRYVAFASIDWQLVAGDADGALDVFVYDRDADNLSRLDLTSDGLGGAGAAYSPTLSADGRYVSVVALTHNDSWPSRPVGMAVHVYDRTTGTSTNVSVRPDGVAPNADAHSAVISADGSVVLFASPATNLADGVVAGVDAIYAAVHFDVQPTEVVVPGSGGAGTFTVTTQAHTAWQATWDWTQYWAGPDMFVPAGVGNGTMSFRAYQPNPDPVRRSMDVTVNAHVLKFTEDVGLSLTSVSPSAGPAAGGTVLTLKGTGFEPGIRTVIGSSGEAVTQFVDATTLRVTTPPGQPGLTWIRLMSAAGDQWAGMDDAFRYLDGTPPQIFSWVDGTLGDNGWYTSDVTVWWWSWDPETAVTSTVGCDPVVINTDTAGTTLTCSATSEGGTASASVTVKRDATPPTISIASPASVLTFGASVPAAYTCADAMSGSAWCSGDAAVGEPVDTSYTGLDHTFYAYGRDQAGNMGWAMATYDVSLPVCFPVASQPKAWWRMEGDTRDFSGGLLATRVNMAQDAFAPAITGQGYAFPSRSSGFLQVFAGSTLNFNAVSIAVWIKPGASTNGMILSTGQFDLQRSSNGSISWTFAEDDGGDVFATIPNAAPLDAWTHVAVTFDAGVVNTWVNGRLVQTTSRPGQLRAFPNTTLTIGGRDGGGSSQLPYVGGLDELQLFDRALEPWELWSIYLSGSHGLCVPAPTTLDVPSPILTTYGAGTYPAVAVLRDGDGQPIAGKPVKLYQETFDYSSSSSTTTLTTDATGTVRWDAPFSVTTAGTYTNGFAAVFEGDADYSRTPYIQADVIVQKATPQITWAAPAPITYGTALGYANQLNATASVPGSFSYSPYAGAVPGAGAQSLTATFFPSDSNNYNDATASVILNVQKALPTLTITGGTFTYDSHPHPATAAATDYRGLPLTPVTMTYNGSSTVPVNAGTYTAVASFAGDANHLAITQSTTVVINKAMPTVNVTGGSFGYDGQSHAATATATGVAGESLTPVSITYTQDGVGSVVVPVNAGTYHATAQYAGDTNYDTRSASADITIGKATPTITWAAPGAIVYGTPIGAAQLNATASVPGSFVYSPAGGILHAGLGRPLSVTFVPTDGANYTSATATRSIDVLRAPLAVGVAAAVKTFGAPLPPFFAVGSGFVNGDSMASLSGVLVFSTPATPASAVGTYAVAPSGVTSPDYTITFVAGTLVISPASTAVTASSAANPSGLNQGVTFTASISVVAPGAGTPTGTIQFRDGSTPLGTVAITNGSASLRTNGFSAGSHTITAVYSGDGNFSSATGSFTQLVNTSSTSSTTAVTTSQNQAAPGASVTLTATVSAPSGLSGNVQFFDGDALIGTATLSGTKAKLTLTTLATGSHAITARYPGNASVPPSISPVFVQIIRPAGTTLRTSTAVVAASPSPGTLGQQITLTATVTGNQSTPPAGVVLFMIDGLVVGNPAGVPLTTTGSVTAQAAFSTSALAHGTHDVTVVYLGNSTYKGDAGTMSLTVN